MVLRDGRGHTIPQMVIILCLLLMTTSDNHVFCQVPRINFRMKLSSIATVIGLGCPGLFTVAAVERRGGGEEEERSSGRITDVAVGGGRKWGRREKGGGIKVERHRTCIPRIPSLGNTDAVWGLGLLVSEGEILSGGDLEVPCWTVVLVTHGRRQQATS